MNEAQLYRRIQMLGFVLDDIGLFLDTHPSDFSAIEYYNKYNKLFREAKEEYERKYGPLSLSQPGEINSWDWVKGPWPWEREVQ